MAPGLKLYSMPAAGQTMINSLTLPLSIPMTSACRQGIAAWQSVLSSSLQALYQIGTPLVFIL
ncbi:hypothetical protein D6C00_02285 [Thiohalobacter thiocyanaticus]|uniref:Uncharacterized protein n=1 Tax=Thiohalobacter thiocyanaticus TaxID=585455 RepID=A0A426QGN0_9GAMM|nr:hypothetical protein D6C00_02285 [Thiohalobacter thiocyanaticus]